MKYIVNTYETIVKNWKDVKPGCTVMDDNTPTAEMEFGTYEAAKDILRKTPSTVEKAAGGGYLVTESWLWEVDGTGTWSSCDCSEMPRLVLDQDGHIIDYLAAADLMEDEIREELHAKLAPCTDQEFFDAYCESYEGAHGEPWSVWWEI